MNLVPVVTQASVVSMGLLNEWYEGSRQWRMNVMSWCSALGWSCRWWTQAFKKKKNASIICTKHYEYWAGSVFFLPYLPPCVRLTLLCPFTSVRLLTAAVRFFSCLVFHFGCVITRGFVQSHPPVYSLQATVAFAQPPPLVPPRVRPGLGFPLILFQATSTSIYMFFVFDTFYRV